MISGLGWCGNYSFLPAAVIKSHSPKMGPCVQKRPSWGGCLTAKTETTQCEVFVSSAKYVSEALGSKG